MPKPAPDPRQEVHELGVPHFGTFDLARGGVGRFGDLIDDAVDGLRRNGRLDVVVDIAIEDRAGQSIVSVEIVLQRQVNIDRLLGT